MRKRLPSLGSFLSLCTLLVLISCDKRTPEQLTGVSPEPSEDALASLSDAPRVEINTPDAGATVSGTVRIEGRTRERGNRLLRTELHIASDQWGDSELVMTTTREGNWSHDWNTDGLFGGSYRITATAFDAEGWSTTAFVSVNVVGPDRPQPPALVSLTIHPDSVTSGDTTTGTVRLAFPAIEDGSVVHVYSMPFFHNNVHIEPEFVEIPEGEIEGTFSITALPVAQTEFITIRGNTFTGQQDYQTHTLRIEPARVTLDSLTLHPTLVRSGETSQATVRLTGPAPEGAALVELESSDISVATVPPNVTVPAGQTTATFTVTAGTVSVGTGVNIRGTYGGVLRFARLIVDRPAPSGGQLSSLTIDPDMVVGGQNSQGTVTLGAAVSGDTEVTLSSTNTSVATVPPSVTVPAGQTSATFAITTLPNNTGQGQFSWISGEAGGVERGASITTTGAPWGPTVASVEVIPSTLGGGGPATGFVTFSSPPTDGAQVSLTSSHPDIVQVPASATWTWSSGVRAFPVTTSPVAANTQVTITASACCGGVGAASGTVTVTTGAPPPPDAVRITRARFRNGIIEVRATSSSQAALLTVFIRGSQTGNDIAIAGMRHVGNGRYEVDRPWINAPVPDELEVRSNLGGSDRDRVR